VHNVRRIIALMLVLLPATAWAQQPAAAQNVEVEPVTCWWRTSTSSVRVGQAFDVALTCSVLETDATRVVVERSRLASTAVQLPPYEVLGGHEGPDLTTTSRRFMQYEYTLRLISEEVFGGDLPIPALQVTYRIESRVQQGGSVQGRDQVYVLPALSMHVASLVPNDATHIREAPVPTLDAIATRESRGTLLRSVGAGLFGLGALMLVVNLARSVYRKRKAAAKAAERLVSHRGVLQGVRRELREVQQQSAREGWTHALAARALAALRVTASYALDAPVTQRPGPSPDPLNGALTLKRGWGSSATVLVSGSATPVGLDHPGANGSAIALRSVLRPLTSARYGRDGTLDAAQLDEAVETGLKITDRLAADRTLISEFFAGVRRIGTTTWAR